MAKLREHHIAENTLVIFTSDNGPHQEGGHQVDFFDSNGPLRGHKRDVYEGGVRVPMIAWWPGQVPAGRVSEHLSGFQDYLPTFCELAGAQTPDNVDGISLVPTLTGKANEQRQHDFLYWEFDEGGGKQALVTRQWKSVRLGWNSKPDGPLELYDHRADPGEQRDVAADHPDVVDAMQKHLVKAHQDHSGKTRPPGVFSKPAAATGTNARILCFAMFMCMTFSSHR